LTVRVGDGEKGTGKTMTLCHVVHYCARQGWLVLHIPDGKNAGAVRVTASGTLAGPEDASSRVRFATANYLCFFHSGEGL